MDIDCELPQNKIVRKDMSSIGPLTFFAHDGVRDVTSDVAQTKSYFETDGNCVCKGHPTADGFISPDHGVKTLTECSDLCKADNNCLIFLHSAT